MVEGRFFLLHSWVRWQFEFCIFFGKDKGEWKQHWNPLSAISHYLNPHYQLTPFFCFLSHTTPPKNVHIWSPLHAFMAFIFLHLILHISSMNIHLYIYMLYKFPGYFFLLFSTHNRILIMLPFLTHCLGLVGIGAVG